MENSADNISEIHTAFMLLGGNQGNRQHYLQLAREHLVKEVGIISATSSIYATAPWGNTQQPDFLNQVVVLKTKSSAEKLLQQILQIEKLIGRVRSVKNAARVIDIDILFFDMDIIHHHGLTIPHPHIQDRRFVLVPMVELAPDLMHPFFKKTVSELLAACTDPLDVSKLKD